VTPADRFGRPRLHTSFRAEPGINERARQFAIFKVDKWIRPSGDVARITRELRAWMPSRDLAYTACAQLNAKLLAAEARNPAEALP
jgi:hypothetical protein